MSNQTILSLLEQGGTPKRSPRHNGMEHVLMNPVTMLVHPCPMGHLLMKFLSPGTLHTVVASMPCAGLQHLHGDLSPLLSSQSAGNPPPAQKAAPNLPLQENPLWEPKSGRLAREGALAISRPLRSIPAGQVSQPEDSTQQQLQSHDVSGLTDATEMGSHAMELPDASALSTTHAPPINPAMRLPPLDLDPTSGGSAQSQYGSARQTLLGPASDEDPAQAAKQSRPGTASGYQGAHQPGLPAQHRAAAAQSERLREARRAAHRGGGGGGRYTPAQQKPAWNAGPAAQPPPRGRRPSVVLRGPAQSLHGAFQASPPTLRPYCQAELQPH
jgi:hypothetical protein